MARKSGFREQGSRLAGSGLWLLQGILYGPFPGIRPGACRSGPARRGLCGRESLPRLRSGFTVAGSLRLLYDRIEDDDGRCPLTLEGAWECSLGSVPPVLPPVAARLRWVTSDYFRLSA